MVKMMKEDSDLHMGEQLHIGTAESEHVEMYLKAIWYLAEKGEEVKVSSIAKLLDVKQPSVVQMLRKLDNLKLVKYDVQRGVQVTPEGEHVGKQMIRNTRLLEVLMKDIFTNALCMLLNHPRQCPHGNIIPKGMCCP